MSEQTPAPTSFQVRLPLLLAATLAVGMFIGQQLPRYDRHLRILSQESASQRGTLDEILRYVEAKYVDSVDLPALRQAALDALFDQLDPHSAYIPPEERKALDEEMQGGFEGIGIEYLMVKDTMQVVAPLADSPAEKAGLLAGDRIVVVDGDTVAGIKMDERATFRLLRGAAGTEVSIGVRRNAEQGLRQYTLRRERIAVKSVQAAYMLDERTGYIKVARFNANTYEEFMEALRPLAEQQGLQDLVLDLRGNPGGYLEECAEMLSQIFPEGKLLVYTKGRTDTRREYKSTGRARFNIQHVAVLIDEHSASASEIVAGAVQDHDRGWIIGRRSFGKGLVQEQYPLS
ncbi:MAG TPA: S41 family peptidase, partial [Saprospiraceae bacterium]|nr:S41 family peptidase [Saprospiraceae bacterium]